MRIPIVSTIFRKELLDTLRDRRTLIFMLLVPIVAVPLLMFGMSKLMLSQIMKAQEEKSKVVVEGAAYLPADLQDSLFQSQTLDVTDLASHFAGAAITADEDRLHDSLLVELQNGAISAVVVIPEAFDQAIIHESETEVEIYFDESEVQSEFALDKLRDIFRPYRDDVIEARVLARELSPEILKPFSITDHNVATARKVAGQKLGGMLPYVVILLCFLGAVYPAIDLAAGEKERGTLETLLVSPASRGEFVLGKYFVILMTSVVAGMLSLTSLTISMKYLFTGMSQEIMDKLVITVDLQTVLLVLAIVIPLAGIFSAILLSISIFAKSFKEAQSYITGINMFIILPAIVSFLPGIKLNYLLASIPVVNISLIMKEAISGSIAWNYVAVAFGSTVILAALTLFFAKKWFEKESVLFRN
ncbi:MAG: ABC transporter permease subunit [bacterium]